MVPNATELEQRRFRQHEGSSLRARGSTGADYQSDKGLRGRPSVAWGPHKDACEHGCSTVAGGLSLLQSSGSAGRNEISQPTRAALARSVDRSRVCRRALPTGATPARNGGEGVGMAEHLERALTATHRDLERVAGLAVGDRHEDLLVLRAPAQTDLDPVTDAAVQLADR
jgi:hypothetical protein